MDLPTPTGGLARTGTGFVFTRAFLDEAATNLVAETPAATKLFEAAVFLFVNNVQPNGTSVYADLTKPTWTGYANPADITWLVGNIGGAGIEIQSNSLVQWTVGADPDAAIYGWGLVKGTSLIGAELYLDPVTVVEGEVIGFQPVVQIAAG